MSILRRAAVFACVASLASCGDSSAKDTDGTANAGSTATASGGSPAMPVASGSGGSSGKPAPVADAGHVKSTPSGSGAQSAIDAGALVDGATQLVGDAGDGESWEELVGGDWSLDRDQEAYKCVRRTLDEDVIIGGFKPVAPRGTHHTTLTATMTPEADGVAECSGLLSTGEVGLWASGVNSPSFDFPPHVGMVLHAGSQVVLGLHLFNTSEQQLDGRSGIEFKRRAASEIEHEAEGTLMGTIDIALPAMQKTQVIGGCTFDQAGTIMGMMPHMHQTGRHMKIVAERAGMPELVLHDGDYNFQEQSLVTVPEGTTLQAGDRLRVECSYDNDTEHDIAYGESTKDEMCFAAVARYPATGQALCIL